MISATRSASSPAAPSCSRTPSRQGPRRRHRGQRVRVALVGGQRLARRPRRGPQACPRGRAAAPPRPARCPRPPPARPPRSRPARTAAGPPRERARARSPRPRRARCSVSRSSAYSAAVRRQQRRAWSRRRRRRGRRAAPAAGASRCWSDCPCTATSGSATSASRETGTDAPPTNARERPSAETLRASSTLSPSTSPPACVDRLDDVRQVGDPQRPLDPRAAAARRARPRCRLARRAAARGRSPPWSCRRRSLR